MLRATLLLLVLGCCGGAEARADETPILPGSHTSIDAAVAKSDFVFEAKLTRLGALDQSIQGKYVGPLYNGAQVEAMSFYKGKAAGPMPLMISLNDTYHEEAPVVGQSYLLFVKGPLVHGGYMVMKMLPATKENRRATLLAVFKDSAQKQKKLQQVQPPLPSATQ